jgi:transcriptional regulator with GAF, ATPase, and Fis domain
MSEKPTYDNLKTRVLELESQILEKTRFQDITHTLFKISSAVNTTSDLGKLFESIHVELSPIINTTNFFIAIYDQAEDSVTFPYCTDSVDECYPPVIEISKTESLTAQVIRTGLPLLITKEEILNQRQKSQRKIPGCTPSEIWLGVPLKIETGIIGVMAVQSYDDVTLYDQTDLEVMASVADQIAIAIKRKQDEMDRNKLISELQDALGKVKKLSGFLPICAHCKKIRDDKGYWNQIEHYIRDHSEAEFSHGICQECSDKFYGDQDWYIEMKKNKGIE